MAPSGLKTCTRWKSFRREPLMRFTAWIGGEAPSPIGKGYVMYHNSSDLPSLHHRENHRSNKEFTELNQKLSNFQKRLYQERLEASRTLRKLKKLFQTLTAFKYVRNLADHFPFRTSEVAFKLETFLKYVLNWTKSLVEPSTEPFKRTKKPSKYFNLPIPPEPPQPCSSLPNTSITSGTQTFKIPSCLPQPTTIPLLGEKNPRNDTSKTRTIRVSLSDFCSSTCDTPPAMKNSIGCSGSPGHTTTRVPSFTKSRHCFLAPQKESSFQLSVYFS